jgi:hypothetical protein
MNASWLFCFLGDFPIIQKITYNPFSCYQSIKTISTLFVVSGQVQFWTFIVLELCPFICQKYQYSQDSVNVSSSFYKCIVNLILFSRCHPIFTIFTYTCSQRWWNFSISEINVLTYQASLRNVHHFNFLFMRISNSSVNCQEFPYLESFKNLWGL